LVEAAAVPENVCAPLPAHPHLSDDAPVDVNAWAPTPAEADLVAGDPVPVNAGVYVRTTWPHQPLPPP
jgi:hypothetical protein